MKRIIALIISAAMLLSCTAFAADTEETAAGYYDEAAEVIAALGIAEKTDNKNEQVTRLDALKAVVNILTRNADYEADGKDLPFVDVPSAEYRSVSYALATGLITGDSVYFRPADSADFKFAETLMTKAMLLYDYPYMNSSRRAQLSNKLNLKSDIGFTKSDLYVMLYNMLCADNMNMMYGIFKIKSESALVTANEWEAYSGSVCKEGYVRLESRQTGKVFNLRYDGDSEQFLGRMVKVFYNSDDYAVLMINSYDDVIAEIDNSSFLYYDSSKREIRWKKGTQGSLWNETVKEGKAVLPKDMDIVFNNRFTTKHSEVYSILEGSDKYNIDEITLYDCNGDGSTDLMKISAYQTEVVDYVDASRMIIKGRNEESIIDFSKEKPEPELKITDENGNTVKLSDIKQNSVLSIFSKLDKTQSNTERIKITVSSTKLLGNVSEKSKTDDEYKINLSGTEYILANGIKKSADSIKVGKNYTLYTDHNGRVAGFEMSSGTGTNIGAVVDIGTEGALSVKLIFKIYSADGEMIKVNASENLEIDGAKIKFENEKLPFYTDDSGTKTYVKEALRGRVVKYTVNNDGYLSSVELPKKNAGDGEFGYTAGINDTADIMKNASRYKLIYKTNGKYFLPGWSSNHAMNFVGIDNSTRIIKIPSENITENREEYFQKGTVSGFSNDQTYAVIGFNANGGNKTVADVVAVVTDVSVDFTNAPYYVVKDICETINKSETIGYELTLINKNGTESKITTAEAEFPEFDSEGKKYTGNNVSIEKGDVIRYSVNSYGDACAFILDYDCSAGTAREQNADSFYASTRLVFGSVYKAGGSTFAYTSGKTVTDESEVWLGSTSRVITVEVNPRNNVSVSNGTPSTMIGYTDDKERYSYVIYATQNGECNIVVEYRR